MYNIINLGDRESMQKYLKIHSVSRERRNIKVHFKFQV